MESTTYSVFSGDRLVAAGALPKMLLDTKTFLDRRPDAAVLIFEDQTGRQVDFDFRGAPEEVVAREVARAQPDRGVGRPRLGVVSREVSLLPRHWEWLEDQPNGISAALRRLVDAARAHDPGKQQARRAREAVSRFMTAMAGDRPGYEDASRALFAGDGERFARVVARWPKDIRERIGQMASDAFPREP